MTDEKIVLLIDGDMVLFAATSACRSIVDWDSDGAVITDTVDVNAARSKFLHDIGKIKADTEKVFNAPVEKVLICLTGPNNFRRDVLPSYKGGRSAKPPGYRRLQDWVKAHPHFDVYLRDGIEADDCLGIHMTHPKMHKGLKRVLWSGDKDLMQIPGWHLKDGKAVEVSVRDGELLFMRQAMTGDITDGYKGLKGFGPAAWTTLVSKAAGGKGDASLKDVWDSCVAAYVKKGLKVDDLLVQARCSRILRWDDYDYKEAKPCLWEPSRYDA